MAKEDGGKVKTGEKITLIPVSYDKNKSEIELPSGVVMSFKSRCCENTS